VLIWQPDLLDSELESIKDQINQLPKQFRLRADLLKCQSQVMRGQWSEARRKLKRLLQNSGQEPEILLTAHEWLAQSLLAQVTCGGGWAPQPTTRTGSFMKILFSVLLLPAYFLIFLILGTQKSLLIFFKAVLRHAIITPTGRFSRCWRHNSRCNARNTNEDQIIVRLELLLAEVMNTLENRDRQDRSRCSLESRPARIRT
jgi:hypothetical protein